MQEDAYKPVKLVAKPGARASMTSARRDDLEHSIKCQCGCPLDVYTCRTTDFSCSVSPQMHGDVMSLVDGGYSAAEILAAFRSVYGERVLMAPVKSGFNWVGWGLPFAALGAGAVLVSVILKRWRSNAPPAGFTPGAGLQPTDEELERISSAVRTER
jgi:cytochrome c-type biogenesis protein CcmH